MHEGRPVGQILETGTLGARWTLPELVSALPPQRQTARFQQSRGMLAPARDSTSRGADGRELGRASTPFCDKGWRDTDSLP